MKINVLIIITCSLFLSCNKTKVEDISLLNGYWEIEKVTFPSGEDKSYKVNTVIDYWQLKDSAGTKEKVMPRLDGRFLSMKEFEYFSIKKEDDKLYIEYVNDGNIRKEKITLLTRNQLGLKSSQNKTYFYKRFEKFSLK